MDGYRARVKERLAPIPEAWPATWRKPRAAAVLVPIVERAEPTILLTKRTENLPLHGGQVSFPGGRVHDADMSLIDTALRETREEIGLASDYVEIEGLLDMLETITGYSVLPVVGFVKEGFTLTPNDAEVAEIFEVPLTLLLDTAQYQEKSVLRDGKPRRYYEVVFGEHVIWGATAGMLFQLAQRLSIR